MSVALLAALALSGTSPCDAHLRTGLDAAAYDRARYEEATAGYRLMRERVSDAGGSARFAAIWVRDGLPQRESHGGHGVDAFYAASLEMTTRDYRLVDLTVGVVAGAPWFSALWEKPRQAQQAVEYWVGRDEVAKALSGPGRRALAIAPYRIGKIAYFATVYDVAPGLEPAARVGLTVKELRRVDAKMAARGYDLARRIAEPGERDRFTAVWTPASEASPCRAELLTFSENGFVR